MALEWKYYDQGKAVSNTWVQYEEDYGIIITCDCIIGDIKGADAPTC